MEPPRIGLGFGAADCISESLEELTESLTIDDLRGLLEPVAETEGARDPGRESARGVLEREVLVACFFLSFFRDDSLPLDSERLGEPSRFLDFFNGSEVFGRPEGVFVPDATFAAASSLALSFASSSLRLSISACFSSSDVSSSLYQMVSKIKYGSTSPKKGDSRMRRKGC